MIGKAIRSLGNALDDGRGLPYRFVGDDWFGGWTAAASGGFTIQARGTEGDDVVTGTDEDERYRGLGGNDTISGAGGRDHLFGDDGDDTIDGGSGNDVLFGGAGQDLIHCGDGNDVVERNDDVGADTIYGGKGDDSLIGGIGNNMIYGEGGNDQLGGNFSDLFGGAGNDILVGAESNMRGGAGTDRLEIGAPFIINERGHDVWGGSGADNFVFVSGGGYIGGGTLVIHDLSNEDYIDLSGVDAKQFQPGDQDFELVPGSGGRAGTMTITYEAEEDRTVIRLYTDSLDNVVDGMIIIPGDHTDFVNFTF